MAKWQKGEPSPNPGGRPKGLQEFQKMCRTFGREGFKIAREIARGDHGAKARDRMRATEFLIGYGFGKATQPVELQGKGGGNIIVEVVSFDGEGGGSGGEGE